MRRPKRNLTNYTDPAIYIRDWINDTVHTIEFFKKRIRSSLYKADRDDPKIIGPILCDISTQLIIEEDLDKQLPTLPLRIDNRCIYPSSKIRKQKRDLLAFWTDLNFTKQGKWRKVSMESRKEVLEKYCSIAQEEYNVLNRT